MSSSRGRGGGRDAVDYTEEMQPAEDEAESVRPLPMLVSHGWVGWGRG